MDSLSIEIHNRKTRSIIFNNAYKPLNGGSKISEQFWKDLFSKYNKSLKNMILACDFNITILDYKQNKKVQGFVTWCINILYDTDNKKNARVGKNSTTAIDHIIPNCIADCQFKLAILKTDVTDHFPTAMVFRTEEPIHQGQKVQNVEKCNYDEKAIKSFKGLREID